MSLEVLNLLPKHDTLLKQAPMSKASDCGTNINNTPAQVLTLPVTQE